MVVMLLKIWLRVLITTIKVISSHGIDNDKNKNDNNDDDNCDNGTSDISKGDNGIAGGLTKINGGMKN